MILLVNSTACFIVPLFQAVYVCTCLLGGEPHTHFPRTSRKSPHAISCFPFHPQGTCASPLPGPHWAGRVCAQSADPTADAPVSALLSHCACPLVSPQPQTCPLPVFLPVVGDLSYSSLYPTLSAWTIEMNKMSWLNKKMIGLFEPVSPVICENINSYFSEWHETQGRDKKGWNGTLPIRLPFSYF